MSVLPLCPTDFPTDTYHCLLPSLAGQIEMVTTGAEPASTQKKVMIICHPHPLYQGTMHNKVVTILAKAAHALGWPTVRFNFRGVDHSTGTYGNAIGEYEDLQTIATWVRRALPEYSLVLAGFSFGAYIAAQFAYHHKVSSLISIAPPVNHFDFTAFTDMSCPWLIVQGEQDDIVPVDQVRQFVDAAQISIPFMVLPDTGHFFHGRLIELQDMLVKHYNTPLSPSS